MHKQQVYLVCLNYFAFHNGEDALLSFVKAIFLLSYIFNFALLLHVALSDTNSVTKWEWGRKGGD